MRLPGSISLAAALGTALFACTFGLGHYATRGDDGAGPDTGSSEGGSPGVDGALAALDGAHAQAEGAASPQEDAAGGTEARDGAPEAGGLRDGGADRDAGPCVDTETRACGELDVDDAGVCTGTQECILGQWAPCVVSRKCPATWATESTPTLCRKAQAIGDSPDPKWTESPVQSGDAVHWVVDRALPFDTYGQNDRFCFIPKQTGNCYTTSDTALEVRCTNGQLKLSGNQFEDGTIHNKRFCVDYTGPSCTIVDRSHRVWTAGNVPCERWFASAAFVVEAAPRCAPW